MTLDRLLEVLYELYSANPAFHNLEVKISTPNVAVLPIRDDSIVLASDGSTQVIVIQG